VTHAAHGNSTRRSGGDTRAAIQHTALELFTSKGYEATSMREIADDLGIKKASLYYHFKGKEDILNSLFERRGDEADELLGWVRRQPMSPELVRTVVLRWVESFSADKLRGIRFLAANPLIMRSYEETTDNRIGSALSSLVDALAELLPNPSPANVLQLRMALLSINAAVDAANGTPLSDEDIVAAARAHASSVIDGILQPPRPEATRGGIPGSDQRG
jgi:AcrR family transcriptional regulator